MATAAENLTKLPPPNGWQGWPMGVAAAARLNMSLRRLRVLVDTGNLTAHKCPDRTNRYNPDELEQLRKDLRAVTQNNGDDETSEDALDVLDEERSNRSSPAENVNKVLADENRSLRAQNLELHKLLISSRAQIDGASKQLIGSLMEREAASEKTITENYQQREAYFNHQAERDIVLGREKAAEARRTEIWGITKVHLEQLVQTAIVKWGVPPAVLAKLEPAVQLLQTMNPNQLQVLLGSGFLTKDQEDLIRKIVATVPIEDSTIAARVAAAAQQALDAERKPQAPPAADSWAAAQTTSAPADAAGTPAPTTNEAKR